tara:strand:+ start:1271 stop:1531 length:261 start_codon:yes stop_codon:yes gene_type:complete
MINQLLNLNFNIMNITDFTNGIKLQFEEEDSIQIIETTILSNLDSWDSLTRFSIIAFLEDEHNYKFDEKDFEKYKTPESLYNLIYK